MTICLSEDNMPTILTRTHRVNVLQAADERGSADALGDDHAERHSRWGSLPECAPEGGEHRKPVDSAPQPSTAWTLFLGVLCIAAVAVCALIANSLPHVGG
jgi:hypothetical protein